MKKIISAVFGITALAPSIALANFGNYGDGYGMMGSGMMGYGGFLGFFMIAGGIAWTLVGILACVWLWQNINKKK